MSIYLPTGCSFYDVYLTSLREPGGIDKLFIDCSYKYDSLSDESQYSDS